eukprot:4588566-Pyramimonas_sp.AAC.1
MGCRAREAARAVPDVPCATWRPSFSVPRAPCRACWVAHAVLRGAEARVPSCESGATLRALTAL